MRIYAKVPHAPLFTKQFVHVWQAKYLQFCDDILVFNQTSGICPLPCLPGVVCLLLQGHALVLTLLRYSQLESAIVTPQGSARTTTFIIIIYCSQPAKWCAIEPLL